MAKTLVGEKEEPLRERQLRWDETRDHMGDFFEWVKRGGDGRDQTDISSRVTLIHKIAQSVPSQEGITQEQEEWIHKKLLGFHGYEFWKLTYHVAGERPISGYGHMPEHYHCFDQGNCSEAHKARVLKEFADYLLTKGTVMDAEKVGWKEPYGV
jgi:hypothetical protein